MGDEVSTYLYISRQLLYPCEVLGDEIIIPIIALDTLHPTIAFIIAPWAMNIVFDCIYDIFLVEVFMVAFDTEIVVVDDELYYIFGVESLVAEVTYKDEVGILGESSY